MDELFSTLISQWGILGVLIIFALYIVGDKVREYVLSSKNQNKEHKNITHDTDIILTKIGMFQDDLKISMDTVENQIEALKTNFDSKHEAMSKRLCELEELVKKQPDEIVNSWDSYTSKLSDLHNKKLMSQIHLGPVLHKILNKYLNDINCDHIVLGAFHNGTSTLSGIPYCKFDIISEKFIPNDQDTDFAPMYKNVDILIHGKLPSIILQEDYKHFVISENRNECELDEVDDVLYRRLLGRGIKQIDFHILRDMKYIPIGFISCLRYDNDNMDKLRICECVKEIEYVYNTQLEKITI